MAVKLKECQLLIVKAKFYLDRIIMTGHSVQIMTLLSCTCTMGANNPIFQLNIPLAWGSNSLTWSSPIHRSYPLIPLLCGRAGNATCSLVSGGVGGGGETILVEMGGVGK